MGCHACKATERPVTGKGGWTRGEQPNPRGHTHHPAHTGHRTHNLHLTKGFSCHCLTGDDKVLLIQNIRDSPGKIAILLFTCGHRPGLQARDLHKAQMNKVAGDLGRYSRPLAIGTAFCSVITTPAQVTTLLVGINSETRCLIPPQGEPVLAGERGWGWQETVANTDF